MVAQSRNVKNNSTIICGTRYGNVMASRGSVIPLFADQAKTGKPITITDPEMTRFMMTLEDAVDLVLFAYKNGEQGDIFVQKSPASTIEVLAKAIFELYNVKSNIKIIGTRHGEKLYETLVNREEMAKAIDLKEYFKIPPDTRDLNYNKYFTNGEEKISGTSEYTSHNTYRLNIEETKNLLLKLDIIRDDLKINSRP
jgi:UDP-glucose 4-epimerase